MKNNGEDFTSQIAVKLLHQLHLVPTIHSYLDVLDLRGQPVAAGEALYESGDLPEVAKEEVPGGWPNGNALRVLLDIVLVVMGELHRLLDPL
ncbi:hypothetical protein E2562_003558 [Oryza meyeriana var. granulata]|uniref:Uncharacterized protein n=1 Tax=Oryza meyeriana var. granulata TaxID=110450 RepID=A0A6G1CND2_9ORYZ|nr:hypothetical protein E2562_003558 [Oryza meyeriana var. granulata]